MLIFITSFVSPHTLPLGVALTKYYNQVIFISTNAITKERLKMGYDIIDPRVTMLNFRDNPLECAKLIDEAKDVVLGGADFHLVAQRIKDGKRVFITHERILKKGAVKFLDPRTWKIAKFCCSSRNKPVYLLAIGDNSARDFRLLGFNSKKIYRFGYFPDHKKYSPEQMCKKEKRTSILWVGRFVGFKRPLMALKAFQGMEDSFTLTMAGSGVLQSKAESYAKRHSIPVSFLGNIPPHEVEKQMLQSHILLSTSHKGEGWGAVINEGMNRGCAVVCAKAIGCAGTLATEENAVLYNTYSIRGLRKALKDAACRQQEIGQKAYNTVVYEFNAEVAAERFVSLVNSNMHQRYENGLLSRVF